MATYYVDLENGNDANDGLSFANRKKSLAALYPSVTNNDVVRVMASADPTSIGTCTWTKNAGITLPSGTVKNIYMDGSWTGATNVTASTTTNRKEGTNATTLAIAAGFTTGKIGYYALGSTEDFSAYQKISLWFLSTVAISNLSNYYIALCSDTTGDTVVDTLTLPAINTFANFTLPVVIDKGSALGSSIQSVAIYATSDPGTTTLMIDDIFATNNINLRDKIANNGGADPVFYSIRSINGTDVRIDQGINYTTTTEKGYHGTTEAIDTVTNPGVIMAAPAGTGTIYVTTTKTLSEATKALISGGWNRTDMSTQTGMTWMNFQNFGGVPFQGGPTWVDFERLSSMNCGTGVFHQGNSTTWTECHVAGAASNGHSLNGTRTNINLVDCYVSCVTNGISVSSRLGSYNGCKAYNCSLVGFGVGATGSGMNVIDCEAANNTSEGLSIVSVGNIYVLRYIGRNNSSGISINSTNNCTFCDCELTNNAQYGVAFSGSASHTFNGLTTSGNGTASVFSASVGLTNINFFNWDRSEATAIANMNTYDHAYYVSIDEGGVANTHTIFTDGGRIVSDTSVRHTASGISWKIQPTSTTRDISYPIKQMLYGIPVKANISHTVSVWLRRDNIGIEGKLKVMGCQINGVPNDLEDSMTAAIDTWEQVSVTFTPTQDGFINAQIEAYGGTTNSLYWDDFEVSASSKNDVRKGDYGFSRNGAYITSYDTTGGSTPTPTSHFFC